MSVEAVYVGSAGHLLRYKAKRSDGTIAGLFRTVEEARAALTEPLALTAVFRYSGDSLDTDALGRALERAAESVDGCVLELHYEDMTTKT